MMAVGGVAGLALWQLGEQWNNPALSPTVFLALLCFVTTFSCVVLALSGPVSIVKSLAGATLSAVVMTGLVGITGARHVVATDLLDDPVMLLIAAVLVLVFMPFLLVWLSNRKSVLRYDMLFDESWRLFVRYMAAWIFVVIFWLVVALSDALLDLVGVTVMGHLLKTDWLRFGLSGAVLGLGLAVVHELRETISPYLLLRLLRLLIPLVLAVVAVFLVAIPVNGLSSLFGEISVAGTLMGAGAVAVTLISTALDRDDTDAVHSRGLRMATQALAVLLPFLTLLAVWAVVLRVRQYGWTPDRLLAMTIAGFLMGYGMSYGGAVVLRRHWMARIRKVNVGMAIIVMVVAAMWLTPVLNVYRISTLNQIERYESGQSTLSQLALWPMAHEWGKAGQAGLEKLAALESGNETTELTRQIAAVRSADNRFQFEQHVQNRMSTEQMNALVTLMPVVPAGDPIDADLLKRIPPYAFDMWLNACQRRTADDRPGCVMVRGAFLPSVPADRQAMVLYLDDTAGTRISHVVFTDDNSARIRDVFDPMTGGWPTLPAATIAQVQDGDYALQPSGLTALSVDGKLLAPAQ